MTDLFDWAALSRTRDPETSKRAAASVKTARLEGMVLAALGERPMTTHELSDYWGIDLVTISPRIAPLRDKGLVQDSGMRRKGRSGRMSIVWRLTEFARAA